MLSSKYNKSYDKDNIDLQIDIKLDQGYSPFTIFTIESFVKILIATFNVFADVDLTKFIISNHETVKKTPTASKLILKKRSNKKTTQQQL